MHFTFSYVHIVAFFFPFFLTYVWKSKYILTFFSNTNYYLKNAAPFYSTSCVITFIRICYFIATKCIIFFSFYFTSYNCCWCKWMRKSVSVVRIRIRFAVFTKTQIYMDPLTPHVWAKKHEFSLAKSFLLFKNR